MRLMPVFIRLQNVAMFKEALGKAEADVPALHPVDRKLIDPGE